MARPLASTGRGTCSNVRRAPVQPGEEAPEVEGSIVPSAGPHPDYPGIPAGVNDLDPWGWQGLELWRHVQCVATVGVRSIDDANRIAPQGIGRGGGAGRRARRAAGEFAHSPPHGRTEVCPWRSAQATEIPAPWPVALQDATMLLVSRVPCVHLLCAAPSSARGGTCVALRRLAAPRGSLAEL